MAKRTQNLTSGDHIVDVKCPECGETEAISVSLSPVYTRTYDSGSLRVKLSQEKADHRCDEPHLPVEAGEDQPEFDATDF